MDHLDYTCSDENGLSFELRVNGTPLGDIIGSLDTAIPYWIVEDDLPYYPPRGKNREPETHIVTVCSCGEYGCGHARCRIIKAADVVTFCNFDGDVQGQDGQKVFQFTRANYDEVISAMVCAARAHTVES